MRKPVAKPYLGQIMKWCPNYLYCYDPFNHLNFACWVILHTFLTTADFFEKSFRYYSSVSIILDPYRALHYSCLICVHTHSLSDCKDHQQITKVTPSRQTVKYVDYQLITYKDNLGQLLQTRIFQPVNKIADS